MRSLEESRSRRSLLGEYSSVRTGPDWTSYVPIRVKTHRAAAFDGQRKYQSQHVEFERAVGFIELIGGRLGSHLPEMHVGFSLSDKLPGPTFKLTEATAIGTLVLPGYMLQSWLVLLSATAYFRIGSDGQGNALSSDLAFWG